MLNMNMDHRTKDLVTDATPVLLELARRDAGSDVDEKTNKHELGLSQDEERFRLMSLIHQE